MECNTQQHRSAPVGNHARTKQCFVKDGPPTSGGIIHAKSRFLQSCCNVRRMACFWWQLTHHITDHIASLLLKESCFKINAKNVPSFAACHLATHPKSGSLWKQGNPSADVPFWPLPLGKLPCLSVLMVSTHSPVT